MIEGAQSHRGGLVARARSRVRDQRAALMGVAVVAVLGFALNDQGIVVPAVMLGILAPAARRARGRR